jgi:predicted phosphate transport protein (TIGR00153 family)
MINVIIKLILNVSEMKFKLKTNKRSQLLDASSQFNLEVLEGSLLLHDCINDLVNGKINKKKLDKVIECEHKADRAKEKYIDILYKDKRALPFLVEDRYRLIKYLDDLSDNSEELARGLKVFPFELFNDIKKDMKVINDLYQQTIDTLVDMVNLMETDFKTAYQKSFHIETLKRSARDAKYNILGLIYQKPEEKSLRVYLTSKICIKLFDMIVRAEEISDFLRSLIIKYPSK